MEVKDVCGSLLVGSRCRTPGVRHCDGVPVRVGVSPAGEVGGGGVRHLGGSFESNWPNDLEILKASGRTIWTFWEPAAERFEDFETKWPNDSEILGASGRTIWRL